MAHSMRRFTTPRHTYTLPMNTSDLSVIKVTYKQRDVKVYRLYRTGTIPEGISTDGTKVRVLLTEEETGKFKAFDTAESQIRALGNDGLVYGSQTFSINIKPSLDDEVLKNDG